MTKKNKNGKTKYRGVIVWDFDRVLFHTKKFSEDIRSSLEVAGMSKSKTFELWEQTRKNGNDFSIASFIRQTKEEKIKLSAGKIRKIFNSHIVSNKYYLSETDKLLHRLKEKGLTQIILSKGHAPFQHKKMFKGCGSSFSRHFEKIMITTRPKYLVLQKLRKEYTKLPFIFVDDNEEHLKLAEKQVPGIITIHYTNHLKENSVRDLERKILQHAKA